LQLAQRQRPLRLIKRCDIISALNNTPDGGGLA